MLDNETHLFYPFGNLAHRRLGQRVSFEERKKLSKVLLLNVDELWLKGKNRSRYLQRLQNQVREVCTEYHSHPFRLKAENQRLILSSKEAFESDLTYALQHLPGLFSLHLARQCPSELSAIEQSARQEMEQSIVGHPEACTFRISAQRTRKDFALNSMQIEHRLGKCISQQFPSLRVDLQRPDIELHIKIASAEHSYISAQKIPGVGGLPVGSSGKLVTLLSGGFDSPVASYFMSARGCRQIFAFFHAYPFVGDEVKAKIVDLCQVLGRYQMHSQLFVIPFGEIQNLIAQHAQERYRTLLFRYAMLAVAHLLAERERFDGLCTGDSLAQVSSQTLDNLALLDSAGKRPVLRPLIGLSKREIIHWARKIGTHDISVRPHSDACSLFAPKRPVIRPRRDYWEAAIHHLLEERQLQSHLHRALENAETYRVHFSGQVTPD